MSRNVAGKDNRDGKPPRQRIWEHIRKHKNGFTQAKTEDLTRATSSTIKDYFQCLLKAGFIEVKSVEAVRGVCKLQTYILIKDIGVEAPRLTKKGELVTQGSVNEAMWGTLRRVLVGQKFNYRELAAFASTNTQAVAEEAAKAYVFMLSQAQYLTVVDPAKLGRNAQLARYVFNQKMNTGPRAPMVQRTKQVYDPNKNCVMWREEKGAEDEIL